jgi:hypothetical protein
MNRLFEKNEGTLIPGTGGSGWPREFPAAQEFVRGDWAGWGDFRFSVDDALVSSYGDVAWVATVGAVQFRRSNRQVGFPRCLGGARHVVVSADAVSIGGPACDACESAVARGVVG